METKTLKEELEEIHESCAKEAREELEEILSDYDKAKSNLNSAYGKVVSELT